MKKNAFTLLELLGVVIILGVLSLITFPIILNQIKNAKQGIKDSTKTLIIDAAKDYYEDNTNNYEKIEGMTYCIDIKTLTDNNYLNKNLKNENLNNIDTNKKVKLIFHNNKFDYEIVDSCTHYTVTFDANGGSVDIDSKEVIENSTYGTLPTPTRAGYTFMGWNGKNIFDMNKIVISNNNNWGISLYTDYFIIQRKNTFSTGSPMIDFSDMANGKYTLSGDNLDYMGLYVNNNYIRMLKSDPIIEKNNDENIQISIYPPENSTTIYSNIQIEEGDTATEYEPYFVTSKTKVTRNFNHTLKAIWKENE